jgi:hypothetical protein
MLSELASPPGLFNSPYPPPTPRGGWGGGGGRGYFVNIFKKLGGAAERCIAPPYKYIYIFIRRGDAKNRIHSDETKALISRALTGENNSFYNKTHSEESKLKIIEAKSAYPVYIYNSYKELQIIFPSVSTLAKLINSNNSTIVNFIAAPWSAPGVGTDRGKDKK